MPSEIKKFKLAYTAVPGAFNINSSVFFNQNEAASTDQKQVKATINQLKADAHRVSYLDLSLKVSDLKQKRLMIKSDEELALAANVSSDYTQGSDSGRLITDLVYQNQYFTPRQPEENGAPLLKANGFIYINDHGQLAGFSLLTDPEGECPGWILATIQNTTARPENRAVTVLATPNYVTSEAQSTVYMDNLDTIEEELKAAICNDKIANLIKGIFNADGSVNTTYLAELNRRLVPNQNLDDRDRKQAQLDILFNLANKQQNEALKSYISSMKQAIINDIDFFKFGIFEPHIDKLLEKFNLSENVRKELKQASELYADIYMLAEKHLYQPEQAGKFLGIANEIKIEMCESQNIDLFLSKNNWAQAYQEAKKTLDEQKEANLAARPNPLTRNFFERNYKNLGYGALTGIAVGLILGLALITTPLPPLSIALLVISAALICFGGISAPEIYSNEKHAQELEQYKQKGLHIITAHQKELSNLRGELPKNIPNLTAQAPEQEVERPTNDAVFLPGSYYSLWEQVPEQQVLKQSEPNNDHTESETPDTPTSPSQK